MIESHRPRLAKWHREHIMFRTIFHLFLRFNERKRSDPNIDSSLIVCLTNSFESNLRKER